MTRPKVVYITGWTRSGSTLLGNILGELPGVLHVGELHYLWQNGLTSSGSNSTCGCGEQIRDCILWSKVLADDVSAHSPAPMVAMQGSRVRTRHILARLLENAMRRESSKTSAVGDRMVRTYKNLMAHGGERLVVDSSKFPAEAALLLGRADVDLRIIHMVRDPRAIARSYQRSKEYIGAMGPLRSGGYWSAFNVASEALRRQAGGRYLRIRHEDFCRNPQRETDRILKFLELTGDSSVIRDHSVVLGENHTVTGNPDRLRRGPTQIRSDDSWKRGLSVSEKIRASVPGVLLMVRYGYITWN